MKVASNMKTYKIELNTEKVLTAVDGSVVSEVGMALQIWQDLKKMESEHDEDNLIKNVLEQILLNEYGEEESIPYPEYYENKDE